MEPSDTPLHSAVKLGDIHLVKKLLDEGASITASNSDANTPLHLAFLLKHYEIVDLLLLHIQETSSYDDMINKDGLSHLHIACGRGNAQLVYSFDYVGANINSVVSKSSQEYPGYTSLQFACESKCLGTIEVVLKAIKLLGSCLDKKKNFFRYQILSRNWTRSIIEQHHQGYSFDKVKKIFLSDFHSACFKGQVDKVAQLIEKGEDVNTKMTQDAIACPLSTPLHLAVEAENNRQKVVELLLAHGADVNLKNGFYMTPLHCALYSDPYRVDKLPYNMKNPEQDDALKVVYRAVKDKQTNPMDPFGLTYFHAAVALNDMETVKKFIEIGQADYKPILPNSRNFSMYTPLHFAAKYGHEDMAGLLLERGADVNANEDQDHFDTPLQVAIRFGQCRMIDFLLARGANPKVVAYDGEKTTLHLLVQRFGDYEDEKPGIIRLVDTLMRCSVDINSLDSGKCTPLHRACLNLDKAAEIVFELLNRGADINALNARDEIPFNMAERKNSKATFDVFLRLYYHVKKLKQLGVKVDPKNDEFCEGIMRKKKEWQKSKEWPAIKKMCSDEELKQQEWIQEIERLRADMLSDEVSLYDYLRMEAREAAEFVENERIEKLVADEQLRSDYAAYGYLIPVAHRNSLGWLESQQPRREEEKMEEDPVHSATDLVPPVYRPKKAVNLIEDHDQQLPDNISLYDAIKLGNTKWVRELLAKGALANSVDGENNSPLHVAFMLNHEEIVDLLLSRIKETSEYAHWPNDQGVTQLHIAASRGNAFVVEKLLDVGANPADFVNEDSPMHPGYTALQFACDAKSLETARILTKAMKISGNIPGDGEDDFAALSHMVADQKFTRFLKKLVQVKEPLSKFHTACLSDATTARQVSEFLNRREDVNAPVNRDSKNYPLYTALHFAVESRNDRQKKVELLLKHGADVGRKNALGMTPLHLACYNDKKKDKIDNPFDRREKKEDDDTLQVLYNAATDKEANPMDAFGLTYLHVAVAQNDLLLVKKMLFQGEDVNATVLPNIRDFSNCAPLHFAARYNRDEMAKLLIERGAKVHDDDDNPRFYTPLQTAIIHGKCKAIGVLLEYGANTKVVHPPTKKTTLHLLADRFGEISIRTPEGQDEKGDLTWFVERLVQGGANVDAKDSEGLTALHSCCANLIECSDMVRWLLYVGADINVKARGKTPLDYANESRFRNNFDHYFMLHEHVEKLKDLGLKVDPNNEKFCKELITRDRNRWEDEEEEGWCFVKDYYTDEALAKKRKERLEEIRILKKDMLTDEVSMYDYIRMNEKQAAAFVGNERLRKIDGIVEAQGLYGIFGYLIPVVYRKSQKWLEDQQNSDNTDTVEPAALKAQGTKRKLS